MNEYIKSTVATVKQHYNMKDWAAATNGPEGTVSKKTQVPLEFLEQGMARLQNNLKIINKDYLGDVGLRTLLADHYSWKPSCSLPLKKTRLSQLYSVLETLAQLQKNH